MHHVCITGLGECEGFSKKYFENFYLGIEDFRGFIPNEELNMIFHLGAGIAVRLLNSNKTSLSPNGVLQCKICGIMACTEDLYSIIIKRNEEIPIEFGDYKFQIKMCA